MINIFKYIVLAFIVVMSSSNIATAADLINISSGAKVSVNSGALVHVNGALNNSAGATLTHEGKIYLSGDWSNAGTQNSSLGEVYFFGSSNSSINCTGPISQFNFIYVQKDSIIYLVDLQSSINANSGFLYLVKGCFKVSGTFAFSNTFINPTSGFALIPANTKLWLSNPNAVISGQNSGFDLLGKLQIEKGVVNVGNGSGANDLLYGDGSELSIGSDASCAVNIDGKLARKNADDSLIYTQAGGIVTVGNASGSTTANRAMFDIGSSRSIFNLSGGSIVLQRPSSVFDDYYVKASTGTVSSGKLQINSATALASYAISSVRPIGSLEILAVNSPAVELTDTLRVLGDVNLSGTGTDRFKLNSFDLFIGGNWNHNLDIGGFNNGTGQLVFNGATTQTIQGTQNSIINKLTLNKTGGSVITSKPLRVNQQIMILSNTIFDLQSNDLTLAANAGVYSDATFQNAISSFNANKCIVNSGSGVDPLLGARIIREVPSSAVLPYSLLFPFGTPGSYLPAEIQVLSATIGANASIGIKPVPREHPSVEVKNKSLSKYWNITTPNITFNSRGVTGYFYYNISEVLGSETNYQVLNYTPAYNDPTGYWSINPGRDNNIVNWNLHLFYSVQADSLSGDWTAGESESAVATYYSRQNGNYNDTATWSKISFGGPVSNTYPTKRTDRVKIQNNTVTVTANTPRAKYIGVETGTFGRNPGKLKINDELYAFSDTLTVEPGATLSIGSADGITLSPVAQGNVRSTIRNFDPLAIYEYSGSVNQVSGIGVPNSVAGFVISKTNTLSLSKSISIGDSLTINSGVLDPVGFSMNGSASGKILRMRGGELIVRGTYPQNYSPSTFTAGTVTFDGSGSVTIPSSTSTPGVAQYNNLNIKGTNRAGNITFRNSGEIKIGDTLNIASLSFADNSWRFITDGSTVRFNKSTGVQLIPCRPALPVDTACYLEYFNLILDGAGTKTLNATGTPIFKVLKDLTLVNSCNFVSNNFNLEIQGSWTNTLGSFNPGTGTVLFNTPVAGQANIITNRDTTQNYFRNIIIKGAGIVRSIDNMEIRGNLFIDTLSSFDLVGNSLSILGNWTSKGATFTYGTSTVNFDGTSTQTISKTSGNINYYNLVVNNAANISAWQIGDNSSGIIVYNNLTLNKGILRTHSGSSYRFADVRGAITRPGSGFIDGELRKSIPTGIVSNLTYEVGYINTYTPVVLNFNGTGGTAGILGVVSDTITTTTTPVSWSDATPTNILPTGSTMSTSMHVARQFTLKIPSNSSFLLGSSRNYDATFNFRKGALPAGDLRNGADPSQFDVRLLKENTTTWIAPFAYVTIPIIGTKTDSSTQYSKVNDFGTFIVGTPGTLTYYTKASGDWRDKNNWSQQDYGGQTSTSFPGEITSSFRAFIGKGATITMAQGVVVDGSNGLIQIDSSGTLMCGTNTVSGTGDFKMLKNSTLGIGDANGITAQATGTGASAGTIRTTTRNFNSGAHNLSSFIYTGTGAQNTGNGLPSSATVAPFDSVLTITVNKPSGALTVTSTTNLRIKDSLNIASGSLSSGSLDIYLEGNLRIASGASFTHNSRTFSFTGTKRTQEVTAFGSLTFNTLSLMKTQDSSSVKFNPTASGTSYNIDVNTLTFASGNKGFIDLSDSISSGFPLYNTGEWTLTMQTPGTVTRTGVGHVDGELRKNVPAGAPTVSFEVGKGVNYRPVSIALSGTTTGESVGYIGAQQIDFIHPNNSTLVSPPDFNYPNERMLQMYWRLTQPSTSTFAKGSRTMALTANYINPIDIPPGGLKTCFDLTYWKGSAVNDWQRLTPPNSNFNYGSGTCGNRDANFGDANYSGSATSTQASNVAGSITLGSTSLALSSNNRILLGDIVVAQQGPTTTHFYSVKNGNWTDPTTWVTDSWTSGTNSTGTFPKERLHIAHIGNGDTVKLDANIGNTWQDSGQEFNEQRLGSVIVEAGPNGNGYLALGTFVIRASVFEFHSGATIETGCADGFSSSDNIGNLQQQEINVSISKNFNFGNHNNGNFVYKPEGIITNTSGNSSYRYCAPEIGIAGAYIANVQLISGGSTLTTFADNQNSTNGYRYFPYNVFNLTAGQTYTFRVTLSGSSLNSYYGTVFVDSDFNGSFTGNNTSTIRFSSGGTADISYTAPAAVSQGTTQLRIFVKRNNGVPSPCDRNIGGGGNQTYYDGEIEDYTVYFTNPSKIAHQVTGGAVPAQIASLTIGDSTTTKDTMKITQSSTFSVSNNIQINKGKFIPTTVNLQGDLINNARDTSFGAGTAGTLIMDGLGVQTIRGTSNTTIYNLSLKNASGYLNLSQNTKVNGTLTFIDDKLLKNTDYSLTLGASATVSPGSGSFNKNRMIQTLGTTSGGAIIKEFTNAAGAKTFTFPIGVDTVYNQAYITATGTYSGTPSIAVKLMKGKHPNRQPGNDNILNKYWNLQTTGITSLTRDTLRFTYRNTDLVGELRKYIPGRYNSGWEINVGYLPMAYSGAGPLPGEWDTITIKNELTGLNGDWLAGEPLVYYNGRVFFSRQSGVWNDKLNWANDKVTGHKGSAASYYPGQLYPDDTVNIDGHVITFDDSTHLSVDSLRIGGTNTTTPIDTTGKLVFNSNLKAKTLYLRALFLDNDGGSIYANNVAANDTIIIRTNLINNSTAGITQRNASNHAIHLKFADAGNCYITGTGSWPNLANFFLAKSRGLLDTVFVNSASLATATSTAADFVFNPQSGVLNYSLPGSMYLSSAGYDVEMLSNSGFDIKSGDLFTRGNLFTNSSTTIALRGGNLNIGTVTNKHLYYATGTFLKDSVGKLIISGAFSRKQTNSTIDFTLYDGGEVSVNTIGNADGNIGFDIGASSSNFSMLGGRIIVANKGGTTTSSADINISALGGFGATAGVIQIGDTTLTPTGTSIKVSGQTPVYDIHFANGSLKTVTSSITEDAFTVKNNLTIDANHTFDLNGNTLNLSGNLTNYGVFSAAPLAVTSSPWQFVLTGTANQTLFNQIAPGLNMYNLRLNKTAGSVNLSSSGNSSLIIRSTLEFSNGNNAYINAQGSSYVENSSAYGSTNQILRVGLGHVFGTLKRWVPSGAVVTDFPVGADTITSYRPVKLETFDASNTAGLVSVYSHNTDHPQIASAGLKTDNNIQRHWTVLAESFVLGTGKKFSLTTQFKNPGDLRNAPNIQFFEHKIYSPASPALGTWNTTTTTDKTDSTIKSINNILFGDYVIGETSGTTFYSYNNGSWDNVNTWSMSGYDTYSAASRIPDQATDIVRIGNNKTVTIPQGLGPEIRSIFVEKYLGAPGSLYILGDLGYLRGNTFALEDDCTIGIQHMNGITPSNEGSKGAVQTLSRSFGVSRYVYNSYMGQTTGSGLPNVIKTIVLDNPSTALKFLDLFGSEASPTMVVNDSIYVRQGLFNTSGRPISVGKAIVMDSVINDGVINPQQGVVTFTGASSKYIVMKNRSGLSLFDLKLNGGDLYVDNSLSTLRRTANLKVKNSLEFLTSGYLILNDSASLYIDTTITSAIQGYAADRYIRTSRTSGSLIRKVATGSTYMYPIGSNESGSNNYTPAEFYADATGSTGTLAIRVSPGDRGGFPGGHTRIAPIPSANYLKRYWAVDSVSTTATGKIRFYYQDLDISGSESNLVILGRYKPVKEGLGGSWKRYIPAPTVNVSSNYFETSASLAASEFLGDWTLGNDQAFRRIFYSRQTGAWDDFNTWTYEPTFSGPVFGSGVTPDDTQDSVVIGGGTNGFGNHVVSLRSNPAVISGLTLGTPSVTGTLNCDIYSINGSYFDMYPKSTLAFGSQLGINTLGDNSGAILTNVTRNYNASGYYEFNGSTTQIYGTGIPNTVQGIVLSGSGVVNASKNINISEYTKINSGTLDLASYNITSSGAETVRPFIIASGAKLRLGGSSNLTDLISGYTDYSGVSIGSYVEFYGNNQIINIMPAPLASLGLGYVNVVSSGLKSVSNSMLIRRDLTISSNATLQNNNFNPAALMVLGSIINSASINNDGIIEIGN